jgi:hypothetical protein
LKAVGRIGLLDLRRRDLFHKRGFYGEGEVGYAGDVFDVARVICSFVVSAGRFHVAARSRDTLRYLRRNATISNRFF